MSKFHVVAERNMHLSSMLRFVFESSNRRSKIIFTLLFFVGLISQSTVAQEENPWQIVILEEDIGRVIAVDNNGLSIVAEVPEIVEFSAVNDARLSPDGNILVFAGFRAGEAGIYLAELDTNICCEKLPDIIPEGTNFATLGTFSPSGTQVVAALSSSTNVESGFVVVYDIVERRPTLFKSTLSFPNSDGVGAYLGNWTEDGIQVAITCLACERPTMGEYMLWNLDADVVEVTSIPYQINGEQLLATNEIVVVSRNESFPLGGGFLGNIVEYSAPHDQSNNTVVIYHDPENIQIRSANWIQNGDALLITHVTDDLSVILQRDGSIRQVRISSQHQFVATTPDGWLARTESDLFQYRDVDGELAPQLIGRIEGDIQVVDMTPLSPTNSNIFPSLALP